MRERWPRVARGTLRLLLCLVTALADLLVLPLLVVAALTTAVGGAGLVLFPRAAVALGHWAEWNRQRAAAHLGTPVPPRRPALPHGVRAQWRWLREDRAVRRDLRWVALHIATGLPAGLLGVLAVPGAVGSLVMALLSPLLPDGGGPSVLGVPVHGWEAAFPLYCVQAGLCAALAYLAVPALADRQARAVLAVLRPSAEERLAARVGELTESRAGVLDAHGAELRRIERDLHDGTQARLVAIAMRLGIARDALDDESGAMARLLREAHEGAEEAMTELRQVIRTMYPPILADRGLEGALSALAAQTPVPTELTAAGLGQLPASVEAAAYFTVAETVTNAAKHSGASRVRVRLTRRGPRLRIEVTDDGAGGVDESRGTGVIGIRRRAAALDGTVDVTSPPGGPTAITVELPCGS
ncbi:sensor histidine kinase [Streptomyces sp. RFCAC02]|uniref:sensor histidine kinase n=1 Tax=Streptomyces sp. RFCAC02 TaxID=2499143 RepID=UPI00101F8A98|nr:sensor histidine kinase [Streptomyces sp. RFCAC02]